EPERSDDAARLRLVHEASIRLKRCQGRTYHLRCETGVSHQHRLRSYLPTANTTNCLPKDPLLESRKLAVLPPDPAQLLGMHHVHAVPPVGWVRSLPVTPRLSILFAPPYQASAATSAGPAAPVYRCRRHRTPQKSGDNA